MIENETQYYATCEEHDCVMDALANAMQFGRPLHIDPILWRISTKSAVVYMMQLESDLRDYNGRISGFYKKGGNQ